VYDLVSVASTPDLLRVVAVPVFAWAAVRDIKTRRVSSAVWMPLTALAAVLFVWDAVVAYRAGGLLWSQEFLLPATISLGVVVPLAYLFWWFGGFGGADAKALLVLGLLFPTFPSYVVGALAFPLGSTELLSPFSLTIVTNGVLVGALLPVALALRNAAAGRLTPVMALGWPVRWDAIETTHGRLLETTEGRTWSGLDLDALRMYLRWRGTDLETLRGAPDRYRDPASLPENPNPPTDGAVTAAASTDGGAGEPAPDTPEEPPTPDTLEDPWGAAAFLEDIEGTAYGTDPQTLREGLEVVVEKDSVWVSPGTPFLVPIFVGLLIALVYGDLLLSVL